MSSDTETPARTAETAKKKLLIIGGGFAGSTLARLLEKRLPADWDIYLLSKTNYVTYNPLLPEVVGALVLPAHVEAPLRLMLRRTRIRMVTVDRVDFAARTVYYHNDEAASLDFDHLVFAHGLGADFDLFPGLKEYALPLKTVGDSLCIRNTILERLEQATIHSDPQRRRFLTKFVVVGGGFSGVEVAGEMNDFVKAASRYYKNVTAEDCQVTIVHSGDHLLPELSVSLGKKTEASFKRRGLNVLLNTRALSLEPNRVVLASAEALEASLIVCTIGTRAFKFCQSPELPTDKGRIVVSGDMSVARMDRVWALGDCALVPNAHDGKLSPTTAQFADRQAKQLAANISNFIVGKPTHPFRYRPAGMLASIGRNNAVAEIYGFRISGLAAFLLWRGLYLLRVPTLSRKVRLFLEWSWAMMFPPDIAHLGFERSEKE